MRKDPCGISSYCELTTGPRPVRVPRSDQAATILSSNVCIQAFAISGKAGIRSQSANLAITAGRIFGEWATRQDPLGNSESKRLVHISASL